MSMGTSTGTGTSLNTSAFASDWAAGELEGAVRGRHAVRQYTDEPISAEDRAALEREVAICNELGNLHMGLVWDEPEAFDSALAHYGKFTGVRNYLVVAGAPANDLERRAGYWGERFVLTAQRLGLNTCWVALTFKRRYVRAHLAKGDQMVLVVAFGHGATQGVQHKSKPAEDVCSPADGPDWFRRGVEWALLAPTAINQQKFRIELTDGTAGAKPQVAVRDLGGSYSKVDQGIVSLHFELGAGTDNFAWANI